MLAISYGFILAQVVSNSHCCELIKLSIGLQQVCLICILNK